jgi:hypothetical protein
MRAMDPGPHPVMRLSRRIPPHGEINAVSRAGEALRTRGVPFIDLTESNPTRVGLPYPADLLSALADPRGLAYDPHPLGMPSARAAIAADCARRGARVDPSQVVLTASTSEGYSWLFKLLCNPGDRVLVPRPSYPLFDHLTRLEGVRAVPYDLDYHGRWAVDFAAIVGAPPRTRALLVVSPNNPTGSWLTAAELARMAEICRARRWALIVDEVFADYPLDAAERVADVAASAGVLSFTLAGASKTLGLPQVKLGWIIVGGPEAERQAALGALELIADAFLSVSTPVQVAAPHLLAAGGAIRAAIQSRVAANLAEVRLAARPHPSCEVLRADGGWCAVIRVPAVRTEEQVVLDLLEHERILVHPGYFFDFQREAFLVVSLLPPEETFADAIRRVMRLAAAPPSGGGVYRRDVERS